MGASARLQALIKFARSKVAKPRADAKFIAAKIKTAKAKRLHKRSLPHPPEQIKIV